MEKDYLISVVVTVYNNEKYLTDCIMSVIKQTYKNIELILVDDGSMDRSSKICDVSAETSGRTRVIHKENGGVVSAWKAGVTAASGDYICFLDGDDYLDTNMLEDMEQYLTGSGSEIVSCDYITELPNGKKSYNWHGLTAGEYDRERIKTFIIPNLLGKEHRFMHITRVAKLISKQLILNNMQYAVDGLIRGEDLTIMLPCIADAERIYVLDRKAYYHHRGDDIQAGKKYDTKLEASIAPLYEEGIRIIEDKFAGVEKSFRLEQMDAEHILCLIALFLNEARGNKVMYKRNILRIAKSDSVRKLVKDIKIQIEEPDNKAAYFVLKHPSGVSCVLLRLYLLISDRRK